MDLRDVLRLAPPREAAFFALVFEEALLAFLAVPAERLTLAPAVFLPPPAALFEERELVLRDADALLAPADFFARDPVPDLPPRRPFSAASAVSALTSLLKLLFWPPAVSSW
ncbi:MAG TPA: hypothetical protein VFB14_14810 [Bryobacteraceae bacterium]|nr:hypothetical protein [Bryobacteraceae bacterium]